MNIDTINTITRDYPLIILALALWVFPWKIAAIYKAAKLKKWGWLVVLGLLVPINTFALPEIILLYRWKKESGKKVDIFPVTPNQKSKIEQLREDSDIAKSAIPNNIYSNKSFGSDILDEQRESAVNQRQNHYPGVLDVSKIREPLPQNEKVAEGPKKVEAIIEREELVGAKKEELEIGPPATHPALGIGTVSEPD